MSDDKRLRIPPAATSRARQLRHTQTPMESRLWAQLRNGKCGGFKFRRQVVMGRYVADF